MRHTTLTAFKNNTDKDIYFKRHLGLWEIMSTFSVLSDILHKKRLEGKNVVWSNQCLMRRIYWQLWVWF